MNEKEELVGHIIQLMDDFELDLEDRLEIFANILIQEGLSNIPPEATPDTITPENLMTVVLNLKEEYGETLALATVHQGLVLLMWLDKE